MSDGGHPAVMSETTVCCNSDQLRVKPTNIGVTSLTCSLGGAFHDGTEGRSDGERAFAAAGKVSFVCTNGRAARGRNVSFLYLMPVSTAGGGIGSEGCASTGVASTEVVSTEDACGGDATGVDIGIA